MKQNDHESTWAEFGKFWAKIGLEQIISKSGVKRKKVLKAAMAIPSSFSQLKAANLNGIM